MKRSTGRAQLMLLRGGLDGFSAPTRSGAAAMADEADWQSFCARIGWQEDFEHDVGDDYADRLAEKIFGGASFDGSAAAGSTLLRDNVIELAVEREAKATKEVPVTESALRRATARGALLALAGVAAAAVVCFFGASVLSSTGGTARALPATDAAEPVAPSPVAQPLESATPDSTAAPVDSSAPKSKPPGSSRAVADLRSDAQRSSRHRSRGRAVAYVSAPSPAGQDHHAEIAQTALAAPVPLAEMIDIRPGALHDFENPAPVDVASLTPRTIHADTTASSEPVAWSTPVPSSRERSASPNWGLTPASERWYGVGLAPTYEPSNMPAGMAVMAQVDVGKALKL